MENYKVTLKQTLIASGQTAAYSNMIVKAIDTETVFETLDEQPVDEIITQAFFDNDNVNDIRASIERSIDRLHKAITFLHTL